MRGKQVAYVKQSYRYLGMQSIISAKSLVYTVCGNVSTSVEFYAVNIAACTKFGDSLQQKKSIRSWKPQHKSQIFKRCLRVKIL